MAPKKASADVIETDLLVVGGGIGGCCAAAKAADKGLRVTLVEKAQTERSGNAGAGIDHACVIFRDKATAAQAVDEQDHFISDSRFGKGRFTNPNLTYRRWEKETWALEELEKLGVPIKWDDGELYVIPTGIGYAEKTIRVHWQNVKPILASAVRSRGVEVLERTMVTDLLVNAGRVGGAVAVNTRTGDATVIKAKAVVLATGTFSRLYNCENPMPWKYKFRTHFCPSASAGDGLAMAYRAGAELMNMDLTAPHFRIRDDLTCSYGNFCISDGLQAQVVNAKGEESAGHAWLALEEYQQAENRGEVPFYYHFEKFPEEFQKRKEVAYADERMISFKIAEDRQFDPKYHWYEFGQNAPLGFQITSGLAVDSNFMTTVRGLYGVGNNTAGYVGVAAAATGGFIVGDTVGAYIQTAGESQIDEEQVEALKRAALAPLGAKDGVEPLELEASVRHICERYVGNYKSEGKLLEGMRRIGTLRRRFVPKLAANNPHHLMRCLEAKNILELAEVHIAACLSRKETRITYIMRDYPQPDPSRDNKVTYQRMENGEPVLEARPVPDLDPEYALEYNKGVK